MLMLQKIKNKIKNFFSPIFDIENKEKGVIWVPIVVGIAKVVGWSLVAYGVVGSIKTGGLVGKLFGDITSWGVKQAMGVLFYFSQTLFGISIWIFEGIYSLDILQQPMTRGTLPIAATVLHGWAIVRDFANMFVVLGFVVIGIATILRIREYEAQKKLLPLIIVALLINFSLLICGIVIDASNIAMAYFAQISGSGTTISQTYANIISSEKIGEEADKFIATAGNDSTKEIGIYVSVFGSMSIFTGILAMVLFIYGILFLFRYVALMCLVMLSPLAFVCSVFPATRSVYEKWKTQFLQWAIIGIPAAFFIYLGTHLIINLTEAIQITSPTATNPIGASLAFWVPVAFMLFAYSLIFQTSAIGASAAIGLATGAMGYAMGGSKWLGGKALRGASNLTGASRLGSAAKDAVTSAGERLKLVGAGTTAANQRARLNEKGRENRINAMTAEEKVQELQRVKWGKEGLLDRAKIVESLAKNNQLDMIPKADRQRLIASAMQYGVRPKDLIGGMQSKDIADTINNPTDHPQYDAETRAEGFKTLSKRNHLDLINKGKRSITTDRARQLAIEEAIQHGVRPEEIEKSDFRFARYNNTRLDRIRTANSGFSNAQVEDAAIQQALDENLTSMSHDQLRNIDHHYITHKRLDRLTPDKINAFHYAEQPSRAKVKKEGRQIIIDAKTAWHNYKKAVSVNDQAGAATELAEHKRLRGLYKAIISLPK